MRSAQPAVTYSLIKAASLLERMFVGAHQVLNEDEMGTMLRERYNASKGLDPYSVQGVRPSMVLSHAVSRNRDNPDVVPLGSPLTRTAIPLEQLSEDDIRGMGFSPSLVAVPERGQSALTTWRHPNFGVHIHRHSKDWMLHEDKWPSIAMLSKAERLKDPNASGMQLASRVARRTLTEGIPHVLFEGVPGYINYIAGGLSGGRTFDQQLTETRLRRRFKPWARAVSEPQSFGPERIAHTAGASLLLGALAAGASRDIPTGGAVAGGAAGLVAGNQLAGALQRSFPGLSSTGPSHFSVAAGLPLILTAGGAVGGYELARLLRDKLRAKQREEEAPGLVADRAG